jgi:hypothetical protein
LLIFIFALNWHVEPKINGGLAFMSGASMAATEIPIIKKVDS